MTHGIRIVDVFTDEALAGKQPALVLDAGDMKRGTLEDF